MCANIILLYLQGNKIIIIAASNSLEYDTEVLQTYETRLEEIKFRIPTAEEREDVSNLIVYELI